MERCADFADLPADGGLSDPKAFGNLLLTAVLDNHADDLQGVGILHLLQCSYDLSQRFMDIKALGSRLLRRGDQIEQRTALCIGNRRVIGRSASGRVGAVDVAKRHPKLIGDTGYSVGSKHDFAIRIIAAGSLHQADRADLKGVLAAVEQIDGKLVHCKGDQAKIFFNESTLCFGERGIVFHEYSSCCRSIWFRAETTGVWRIPHMG